MFDEIEEYLGFKEYNVWYFTPKQAKKKRKSFDTIEEITKWCKRNKRKVKIDSGSWQVFEIMKTV